MPFLPGPEGPSDVNQRCPSSYQPTVTGPAASRNDDGTYKPNPFNGRINAQHYPAVSSAYGDPSHYTRTAEKLQGSDHWAELSRHRDASKAATQATKLAAHNRYVLPEKQWALRPADEASHLLHEAGTKGRESNQMPKAKN